MFQEQYLFRAVDAQMRFYLHGSVRRRDIGDRSDIDSVACIMVNADMILRHKDQRHVAVDAPEEGKIGPQRRNPLVVRVIHLNPEAVGAGVNEFADIKDEGCIASLVSACVRTVYVKVDNLVGSFEAHEDFPVGEDIIDLDCPLIPSYAPEVPRFIIHGIFRVPRVRERDRPRDRFALFPESPAIVYASLISWCARQRTAHKI